MSRERQAKAHALRTHLATGDATTSGATMTPNFASSCQMRARWSGYQSSPLPYSLGSPSFQLR